MIICSAIWSGVVGREENDGSAEKWAGSTSNGLKAFLYESLAGDGRTFRFQGTPE